MNAVRHDGLLGKRLLTSDADAGYVILRDWPTQRVFLDDRYDMYPRPVIADYLTLSHARAGWATVLARYDVQVIVWAPGDPLVQLVEASGHWPVGVPRRGSAKRTYGPDAVLSWLPA